MNKHLLVVLFFVCLVGVHCKENDGKEEEEGGGGAESGNSSWWSGFKSRVKSVLSRWRDDIKLLWDDVLTKAEDMRGWTAEVFESFKQKMKEWVETRKEVPDDEKNEIETFISKLKVPTDAPAKNIDP